MREIEGAGVGERERESKLEGWKERKRGNERGIRGR